MRLLSDKNNIIINGWLSRSSTGSSLVGPTKVKAHNSVLFTKSSLVVGNQEHLVDFAVTLYFTSFCCKALHSSKVQNIIIQIVGIS